MRIKSQGCRVGTLRVGSYCVCALPFSIKSTRKWPMGVIQGNALKYSEHLKLKHVSCWSIRSLVCIRLMFTNSLRASILLSSHFRRYPNIINKITRTWTQPVQFHNPFTLVSTMASKIEDVVASLVSSAPPGELSQVSTDLTALLSGKANQSTINTALESYASEEGAIVAGSYVISRYSKAPGSTKYIDYVSGKAFNVDLKSNKVLDVEDYAVSNTVSYFDALTTALKQYGEDHYPSLFAFNVIPDGSDIHIIIVGQRINADNFYTGQWRSHYVVSGDKSISGDVSLDIHYYEDGNVRLTFGEKLDNTPLTANASSIVNAIDKFETATSLAIVGKFEELNQKSFKNLRRLLPVTRSKIQWGKAIGNYRLGSDVVNKK